MPAANRVTAFSAYRMAINAGWAFGPATAGFIAGHGYFWLFAGDAATSALFGIVALVALPESLTPSSTASSWSKATRELGRDRRLHRVPLASFGIALVFSQMNSTYGLAMGRLGLSPPTYGALLSLNGVLVVLVELPLTTVTRRFPPLGVISLGYLLIGAGFALNAFALTVPALAACVVVQAGEMCAMPVASAYVAELSPRNMRGRYMGTYGRRWTLAKVVGPGLGMWLLVTSPAALWLTGGTLGVAAALAVLAKPSAVAPVAQGALPLA